MSLSLLESMNLVSARKLVLERPRFGSVWASCAGLCVPDWHVARAASQDCHAARGDLKTRVSCDLDGQACEFTRKGAHLPATELMHHTVGMTVLCTSAGHAFRCDARAP